MNPPKSLGGRSRLRRWKTLTGLFFFAVLFCLWCLGVPSTVLNHRFSAQLSNRDYEAAEDTLALIQKLSVANAETSFWEARLNRKLLRIANVPPRLRAAAEGGVPAETIRREFLLLQAQTGQIAEILDQLDKMLLDPGGDGAEICEAYVNGTLMTGATELALAILPVWKAEFPNDPQAFYAHARLIEFQGETEQAVNELRRAVELKPNHWPSRYALGRIMFGQNRFDAAITEFDAAYKMRYNSAVIYQKAKCLRALGRTNEAHDLLQQVVNRPGEEITFSFQRVGEPLRGLPIQLELGTLESALRNYDSAIRWLDQTLAADPRNLDARYARAIALRELRRTEEADREFAEVKEIREQLKEVDRLVDDINKTPDEPHIEERCRVGELLLRYENSGRGELWLRETLSRDASFRKAHQLLADYYSELAKTEPAWRELAEKHRKASDSKTESETVRGENQ